METFVKLEDPCCNAVKICNEIFSMLSAAMTLAFLTERCKETESLVDECAFFAWKKDQVPKWDDFWRDWESRAKKKAEELEKNHIYKLRWPFKKPMTVECQRCGKFYEEECPGHDGEPSTQGWECAGSVKDGVFYGHYGSHFDTSMLRVAGLEQEMDPVCDYCVMEWIKDGRVTYIGDNMHQTKVWGPETEEQLERGREWIRVGLAIHRAWTEGK